MRGGSVLPFLVLLVATLPVVNAQQTPTEGLVVEFTDPANDVALAVQGTPSPGLPPADHVPYVDITAVRILDPDEEYLVFEIKNSAGFKRTPPATAYTSVNGGSDVEHRVLFDVPGEGGTKVRAVLTLESYRLRIQNETEPRSDLVLSYASLCFPRSATADRCDFFGYFGLQVSIGPDGSARVLLPKSYLLRDTQRQKSTSTQLLPIRLLPGDTFTNVRASASSVSLNGMPTSVEMRDVAPDGAALEFSLLNPSPTSDLEVAFSQYAVIDGQESQIPVQVTNLGVNKRIINFTISVLEQTEGSAWELSMTPSTTLGPGKSTNLTMRVRAPPFKDGMQPGIYFRVRANVITEPGTVAIAYSGFQADVPLDATHNTFWVHTGNFGLFGAPLPIFQFGWHFLTRHESEPYATDEPAPMNGGLFFGGGLNSREYAYFWSDDVPNAATFRKDQPAEVRLEFESQLGGPAHISLDLEVGELPLGGIEHDFELKAGRTAVELKVPINPDLERMDPQNGTLFGLLELTQTGPQGVVSGLASPVMERTKIVPKASWVKLPIDREAPALVATPSLKVSLQGAEDLEGFVNPGRTTVYELDLRNEETKMASLEISAENVTEGWGVELRPALRYKLGANESVHLGVLVSPNAKVGEGAEMRMRLVVKDAATGSPVAAQWIRTIATSGVDIDNETFEAREEDAGKLDTPRGQSPSLGAPLLVALLLGLGWVRRRR